MTLTQLNKQLKAGDTRLYAKMPKVWADMELHEGLRVEGLKWAIYDDEGEVVRPKTYREYLLFLAEDDDFVLAKLLEHKHPKACFDKTLEKPERDLIVDMLGIENLMNHNEALAERDRMIPPEEII